MNLSIGLSLTRPSGPLGFTPASLFASGEEGAWYDPSDLTTLFQDDIGTTSAGAGDPVGLILDKSKGGLSATELVTNGDFSNGTTGWTYDGLVLMTVSSGQAFIDRNGGGIANFPRQAIITAGKTYQVTFTVVALTHAVSVYLQATTGRSVFATNTTGTFTAILVAGSADALGFRIGPTLSGFATCTIDNVSIRELPGNHATQATPTARPTLQVSSGLYYLDFDGADDCLQTPAINFNVTDKMSVFAGITKETDAVSSIICELGAVSTGSGSFSMFAGNTNINRVFGWSTSALQTFIGTSNYPAPVTVVNTLLIDRAGTDAASTLFPRINGSAPSFDDVVNQNVFGTFVNSNLNIGARDNGASSRLDGRIYGLIVRGAASIATEISGAESYLAAKSGVTL